MVNKKLMKKMLAYCLSVAMVIGATYVVLIATGKIPWPGACITEDMSTISNLSGMKFEVTYTNCDMLTKDEAVSVYVSTASVPKESAFARWSNRRTLVFRYDPGRADRAAPAIKASGNNRILISIPEISSVFLQSRKWGNVSIDYDIGHIEYQ